MAVAVRFFGFDSLMELIAFAIALAVAYQALKGYRISKERTLLYLNISFVLLGAGLLVDALANIILIIAHFNRAFLFLFALGYTINFVAQLLAYGILALAYLQQTKSITTQVAMAALPILFFEQNSVTELILMFLLVYVSIQTAINYSIAKTTNALLVFGAFTSLAISHTLFLLFTFAPVFFPFAHIAQLFGFLMLLAMLLRVNKSS